MNQIYQKGYGKINLGLEILYKREDGYHEVDMILQSVQLHDVVTLTKRENGNFIRITCNKEEIPLDEKNIAYKAALLLKEKFQIDMYLDIHIKKQIPIAAGMAGGSADAAAVLKGINKLYELNLSLEELAECGLSLGADVPFCVYGGCARARGIGEDLTWIRGLSCLPILILKPKIAVSTGAVYKNLKLDNRNKILMDEVEAALIQNDILKLDSVIGNRLEDVVFEWYPKLKEYKTFLKNKGALISAMSGSGSTIFGIFNHEDQIKDVIASLKQDSDIESFHITYAYHKERI